jgi:predicted nucleic acid-binding protein
MNYLPDVNLWIALAAERHVHHGTAGNWFDTVRGEGIAFCRITQLGFLRLVTNRHVMQEEALAPDAAWGGLPFAAA